MGGARYRHLSSCVGAYICACAINEPATSLSTKSVYYRGTDVIANVWANDLAAIVVWVGLVVRG